MNKRFIISEEQERVLTSILKEDVYKEPTTQNPSMKKANKPYCINPDKVLLVKNFLDKGFAVHDWEKVGANGLPMRIKIFSMNASNGEPLKWMYQDQLHDLLVDHFQNMFSNHDERDLFMKQVLKDWINGSIGVHGNLTSNFLQEGKLNEITTEDLTAEANNANTEPSDAQKKAGNYKMGHVFIKGMKIAIENPKGSYRKYKDENGIEGRNLMKHHYGYFNVTKGKDGDAVDCFLGPYIENFDKVYCVDQKKSSGEFDETKVMLGFNSKEEAKDAYLSNYSPNWKGFMDITGVTLKTFKKWLYRGRKQRQPFAQYVYIQRKKLNETRIIVDNSDDNHENDFENNFAVGSFGEWKRVRKKSNGLANLKNLRTGEILSDQWFDWVGYMVNGAAIVMNDNRYNLLNEKGEIILPEWHEDIWDNDDGTFDVKDGGKVETVNIDREKLDEINLKAAVAGGMLALSPMAANANNYNSDDANKQNVTQVDNQYHSTREWDANNNIDVHYRKTIDSPAGKTNLINFIVRSVGVDEEERMHNLIEMIIRWADENGMDYENITYGTPKMRGSGSLVFNGDYKNVVHYVDYNITIKCKNK